MWAITPSFIQALKSPVHTMRVRLTVLDTDLNPVPGGVFHDVAYTADSSGILVDGSVDLDIARGARRTFSSTLLNSNGEWSPQSDWSGMFYVDRLVRIERGIEFAPGAVELVPIGTFFLDSAEVVVERNMSMISLSGTDGWKKLAKSQLGYAKTFAAGTPLVTVLTTLLQFSGVNRLVLDQFESRTAAARQLGVPLSIERNDNIGDVIIKLATDYGFYAYFDPIGQFVTSEVPQPGATASVWTYDPEDNNNLLVVRASYKDENFCNAVCVYATGNKNATYTSNRANTDPTSPTNVNKVGRRTYYYETDTISSQAAADACASKLYLENMKTTEDIDLEAICNPAFEGGDIITVREREFANLDTQYIIRSFSVPLASTRMSIKLQRAVGIS